jgi:hypothetical protein
MVNNVDFYLTADPITPGVVENQHNWRSDGNPTQFGNCSTTPVDLAWKITLDLDVMGVYVTGSAGAGYQLRNAADDINPSTEHLTITETEGKSLGGGGSLSTYSNAKE